MISKRWARSLLGGLTAVCFAVATLAAAQTTTPTTTQGQISPSSPTYHFDLTQLHGKKGANPSGKTAIIPHPWTGSASPYHHSAVLPAVTPEQSAATIAARSPKASTVTTTPFATTQISGIKPLAATASDSASGTVGGPGSLTELARSLKNNPDLIYQYVYNNIDYYPIFGEQKGPIGAVLDGTGTDFDQAALLVNLLTIAGYQANFQFGQITLTAAQASNWLGVATTDSGIVDTLLSNGGIPHTVTPAPGNALTSVTLSHVWVNVVIGGTTYAWDPSFKTYATKAPLANLATIMGYSQSTFVSNSEIGATVNANYVQNVNPDPQLVNMANSLVTWIKANKPDAQLDDILGGKSITPVYTPNRVTKLSYQTTGNTATTWTGDIPTSYKISLEIQWAGIDQILTSDQIYGHRLDLAFDGDQNPYLKLDDTVLQEGYSQDSNVSGYYLPLTIIFTHNAYSSPNENETDTAYPSNGSNTNINVSFGPSGRGQAEFHRYRLGANMRQYGNQTDFDPVTGESEAIIGTTFNAETTKVLDIIDRLNNTKTIYHHRYSIVQENDTPEIGISAENFQTSSLLGTGTVSYTAISKIYNLLPFYTSMIEAVTIAEETGVDAISVPLLITLANSQGDKIYNATSSNWTSTVEPALSGYQSSDLTNFTNDFINNGDSIMIPSNGSLTVNNWTGWGIIVNEDDNDFAGSLHGGIGSSYQPDTTINDETENNQEYQNNTKPPEDTTAEPIDLASGNYLYEHRDLSIGSQSFPYSLTFARHYTSGQQFNAGSLGLGWNHNFSNTALVNSDGFRALGESSAIDASSAIAALYVVNDLTTTSTPTESFDRAVITEVSFGWLFSQMQQNTVVVSFSDHSEIFVKLANGTYNPPVNNANSLTVSGGLYTYTTPQQVKLNFNTVGNIATQVFPNGVTVTYNYNASNQLSSVSNGLTRTLTFNYTNGNISSVTDGTGRSVVYTYDSNNNLVDVTDANGQITRFQYDLPGRLIQIYKPANPTTAAVINTYDTLGRVATQTNALNQTWNYYFSGSRSEEDDPLGNAHTLYFNYLASKTRDINALNQETDYAYDGLNRVTSITLPEGNITQYTYDAFDNILTKTLVAKPGSGLANIVNTFTYDATYHKVHTAIDGRTNTTTFNYDPSTGNLLNVQEPVVTSQTPTRVYTYNSHGQVATFTDETGIVTQNNYDTSGGTEKLLSSVRDYGVSPHLNLTTSYAYDSVGNVTSVTDPNTHITQYLYDPLRRETQITYPTPFSYLTKFTYDANSNLLTTQKQTGITATPWQTTTNSFTLTDKLKTSSDPSGNTSTNTYDGRDRLATTTDPDNRTTTIAYDALSRISTVTDPSQTVQQTKTYTVNGFLYQLKDSRNNTTTYSYDGFDRLAKILYPDSSSEQRTSYDGNNNLLSLTSRSGNTISMTYDALNRLSTKLPTGEGQVTSTYDLAGRLKQIGKPTVSGDPSTGNFTFNYDTAGRLANENTPDAKEVQYGLDGVGNLTKLTYPDGYYVTRGYDQLNRLTDLYLNGATTSAAHFAYDQLSRYQTLTYSNGASVGYNFQLNNDLSQITQTFVGSSVAYTYGFNHSHQATSQNVSDSTYLWHPAAAGTTTYAAAGTNNEYPTVGGTSYTYDGNANLKSDGTWTYTYDTEDQLLSATKTGTTAAFVYDPLHRQAQKTVGTTLSRYVYGRFNRLADYNGSTNALLNRYIYGDGIDQPLIQVTSSGTISYFHQDRINSVIATSSSSGAVGSKFAYGPNGESSSLTATGFGYTGQRFDSETGLYFYLRRYYSTTLGRFLQPDPLHYRKSRNLYEYAKNDAINHSDPTGLASDDTNLWGNYQSPPGYLWGDGPGDNNPYLWGSNPPEGGYLWGDTPPEVPFIGNGTNLPAWLTPGFENTPLFGDDSYGLRADGPGLFDIGNQVTSPSQYDIPEDPSMDEFLKDQSPEAQQRYNARGLYPSEDDPGDWWDGSVWLGPMPVWDDTSGKWVWPSPGKSGGNTGGSSAQ